MSARKTRKIIQIALLPERPLPRFFGLWSAKGPAALYVLCNDGTVWARRRTDDVDGWFRQEAIPQPVVNAATTGTSVLASSVLGGPMFAPFTSIITTKTVTPVASPKRRPVSRRSSGKQRGGT